MKKISYKTLCNMLNVTDKDIKARIEEARKQSEPVYESEKYGFDWIANVVNPGVKLTATELGHLWKSLSWANSSQYPKYFMLSTIAAMLFCYRVNVLNESFTK